MGDFYHEDNFGSGGRLPETWKEGCLFCSYVDRTPRHLISKNERGFSVVYGMDAKGLVLSKGQSLVISREHRENFSELTKDEWRACLPLIKDAIEKINKSYHPVGFDVFSSLNKEGGQSHFHSHIHIIPKYKRNYGYCRRKWDLSLTSQDYKEIEEKLQTKKGIVKENGKAVAELVPFGNQAGKGHIVIRPKKPIPNNIENLDKETWAEMWELMKESVKKCKENLGAKGFWWHTPLGQMTDVDQTTCSEFKIDIMPRWNVPTMEERHGGKIRSIPENERIAEKLRSNSAIKTLYRIVKEQKEKKGRKLKIICDWDECIMPTRPWATYHFSRKKTLFSEFFKNFWEEVIVEPGSVGGNKKVEYIGRDKEIEEAIEELKNLKNKRRESDTPQKDFYSSPERYKAPFLSIAEELLLCLKEDLISELVCLSSYRKGKSPENKNKEGIFKKTFGQFPNTSISIYEVGRDEKGNNVPRRKDWIQKNHPDFDIFIDDNHHIINSTSRQFSTDKFFVLPDYYYTKAIEGDNIHHVKTAVSDVKIEDFAKAAKEYKVKKKKRKRKKRISITEAERERNKNILNGRRWDSPIFSFINLINY